MDKTTHLFIKDRNVILTDRRHLQENKQREKLWNIFTVASRNFLIKGNFKIPNCKAKTLETETIRDLFTAGMTNDEVKKDLLAETKTPEQVFE